MLHKTMKREIHKKSEQSYLNNIRYEVARQTGSFERKKHQIIVGKLKVLIVGGGSFIAKAMIQMC